MGQPKLFGGSLEEYLEVMCNVLSTRRYLQPFADQQFSGHSVVNSVDVSLVIYG